MVPSILFVFIFGLIIGSFLNVVGLRWNSSRGLSGRSACPHCNKKLFWYELVPVVSYFMQSGRCRGCKSKISLQYPFVEILTGLIFLTLYLKFGLTTYYLLLATVFSIYIAILIYDFRHKIIPDSLVYSAIIIALVYRITTYYLLPIYGEFGRTTTYYLDFLAGPIVFLFFASIWVLSRGRAMGFGDAKLGLSIGLLFGAKIGFSAIALAFWIGALVGLGAMVFPLLAGLFSRAKRLTIKSEIPFAPFLVLGAWLALIYDLNLLHIAQ